MNNSQMVINTDMILIVVTFTAPRMEAVPS